MLAKAVFTITIRLRFDGRSTPIRHATTIRRLDDYITTGRAAALRPRFKKIGQHDCV